MADHSMKLEQAIMDRNETIKDYSLEIERLRAANEAMEKLLLASTQKNIERAAVIEECALAVERCPALQAAPKIVGANAIRALKDKP